MVMLSPPPLIVAAPPPIGAWAWAAPFARARAARVARAERFMVSPDILGRDHPWLEGVDCTGARPAAVTWRTPLARSVGMGVTMTEAEARAAELAMDRHISVVQACRNLDI